MVLVTTNGRILDIFGPYSASINDAEILKSMFNTYANQINGKLSKGKFNVCFSTVANEEKRFIFIRDKCSNKMLLYSFIFLTISLPCYNNVSFSNKYDINGISFGQLEFVHTSLK